MRQEWRSGATTRLLSAVPAAGPARTPGDRALGAWVSCRTTRERRVAAVRHAVTVRADWSVVTPHALDAERVAVALGGYSSCVGLVDAAVPALRRWVGLAQRSRPVDVRCLPGTGQWRVGDPAVCCRGRGFASAGDAASHARGVPHLAMTFGASKETLAELVSAAGRAWGADLAPLDGSALAWQAAAACQAGQRDVEYLWRVGLSAESIVRAHAAVGERRPLPRRFYLGVLARRVDLGWVARTVAAVPEARTTGPGRDRPVGVRLLAAGHLADRGASTPEPEPLSSWLAWTAAAWDREAPAARGRWLALGMPRDLVLMLGDAGIDPDELAAYAAKADKDPVSVARSLCGPPGAAAVEQAEAS